MLQEEETTNGEAEKEKEEEKEKEKVEKRFMVPSLLPEDPPEEVLNRAWPTNKGEDVVEYARIYELNDFIPIGLFARLIVRMMHIPGTSPLRVAFAVSSLLSCISLFLMNCNFVIYYAWCESIVRRSAAVGGVANGCGGRGGYAVVIGSI
jgi:hypothetical protein